MLTMRFSASDRGWHSVLDENFPDIVNIMSQGYSPFAYYSGRIVLRVFKSDDVSQRYLYVGFLADSTKKDANVIRVICLTILDYVEMIAILEKAGLSILDEPIKCYQCAFWYQKDSKIGTCVRNPKTVQNGNCTSRDDGCAIGKMLAPEEIASRKW